MPELACTAPVAPTVSTSSNAAPRDLLTDLVELAPDLRARALRLSGDSAVASDIAQDTLERAIRFADRYEPGTNLRAWAFQILFNVFVTRWRRTRRERRILERLSRDPFAWTRPVDLASTEAVEGTLLPSTRRKLDSLPEVFRTAIDLVDLQHRSYREAARELGVPVGTVMSRLHRGRKLLVLQMAADTASAHFGKCLTRPAPTERRPHPRKRSPGAPARTADRSGD
jgi:RNA polymerase sigma-70 factor (ECF subfamily)